MEAVGSPDDSGRAWLSIATVLKKLLPRQTVLLTLSQWAGVDGVDVPVGAGDVARLCLARWSAISLRSFKCTLRAVSGTGSALGKCQPLLLLQLSSELL